VKYERIKLTSEDGDEAILRQIIHGDPAPDIDHKFKMGWSACATVIVGALAISAVLIGAAWALGLLR